jgi:hypothetical protein
VIITPHVAGLTPHYYERAAELFAENLDRFLSGQPLSNVFDPARGMHRCKRVASLRAERLGPRHGHSARRQA